MNIAFPALFVLLLALPGLLLRYGYREWGWKTPVYRLPLGDEIAKSVFAAAVLNLLWVWIAHGFGYRIKFDDVLVLLTGGFGLAPEALANHLRNITAHPGAIAAYFLSLYSVAGGAGWIGRLFVRGLRLDLRFKFLRFDNFWHYALNAELPLFHEYRRDYAESLGLPEKEFEHAVREEDFVVIVSAVVNHGRGSFVYFGYPLDYFFDRSGQLERIVIEGVSFEELLGGKAPGSNPAPPPASSAVRQSIVADVFVLNASDIHNIGIQYIFGSQTTDEEPAGTG